LSADLLMSAVVTATAARVFLPDARRIVRRSLAAGVRVGVASLGERVRSGHPPRPAPNLTAQARAGEEERL
jgi:hypothetical protein